jgi:hypothetical protein
MTLYYTAGANNLIQFEIALKIANKIYVNKRFSACIVVLIWSEGNPTGVPIQRILYWQVRLHRHSIALISAVIYFFYNFTPLGYDNLSGAIPFLF